MNIKGYSEKEIEQVVNSFKAYIKLVVNHAVIDYARKLKSQKYKIISLDNNECIEKEMSLSRDDNGIFLLNEVIKNMDYSNIFSNSKHSKVFKKLTENEQNVLGLYSENYSIVEISKITALSIDNVKKIKYRAIKKFKLLIEGESKYECE